jgi:hypothetical protein
VILAVIAVGDRRSAKAVGERVPERDLVPRGELDALRAENRRLRREAGDREALKRIGSDSGEGRTFTREDLAEAWGISE